jgi:hypothetical protein
MIFINKDWSDFFSGQPVKYDGRNERLSGGLSGYVYVVNSFFMGLTSTSDGGAIYFSSSDNSILLVEKTSFYSITGSRGGSLYFGTGGQCVISKTCSINSTATGTYGAFSVAYVSSSFVKNHVVDSSFCLSTMKSGYSTLEHRYGDIILNNINLSSNYLGYISAFRVSPTKNGSNVVCSVKYSSINNNKGTTSSCIFYCAGSSIFLMDCCNMLSNTQTGSSNGAILSDGDMRIINSCILNDISWVVEARNCQITFSNCNIDFNNNKVSGTVIFTNSPNTYFVNVLYHFEYGLCVAEHYSSPVKKRFYSCGRHNVNFVSFADYIFFLIIPASE